MAGRRHRESAAMALGRRVRALRNAKGWSQERLAEHANLDRSYIAGIETGSRNPSLKALELLAKGLQVGIVALFKED
jgi:transcriptional regulator with XRE-family HTH domain